MPPGLDEQGWRLDEGKNWPQCGHCGSLARPAIWMFGDFGWKYYKSQDLRWNMWREAVLDICGQQDDVNVLVNEVGCGPNVPTCRNTSEMMVEDVIKKKGGKATLIRNNFDFPLAPEGSVAQKNTPPIASRGLLALKEIDTCLAES